MTDKISPEDFDRLTDLASLELPADEAEYLRKELNNQMISIEILESIPIDAEIGTAAHGIPYDELNSAAPREDISRQDPNREEILKQAPELEDGYIVVPDISYEELD
ncbi:MAG: aspartyl/glutamyl-tRNA amidotransferase subunit C [Anaerolineales bacterium]|nr:aspartyl/glutamyl-tRNA amidotransferase subunit C [Anaerolineales bacterium]